MNLNKSGNLARALYMSPKRFQTPTTKSHYSL